MGSLVSVIIVNWNGMKYLRECLDSLLTQTYPELEIIVVDNASTDGSPGFVKENYPIVKVVESGRNLGFAGGANLGIKASKGQLIALFNQDAAADRLWLERLANVLTASEDIAAVSGKVYKGGGDRDKNIIFSTWTKIDPHSARAYDFAREKPASDVDSLQGCAMLLKRKVMDEIGPLDEDYFLYFEETDWCARAIRAGYRLAYVPDAIAWHVVSGSIADPGIKLAYITRNRVRFALKNFDATFLPLFALLFFRETAGELLNGLRGKGYKNLTIWMKALGWNAINLPGTLNARLRDLTNIKGRRSYNRSLPLRSIRKGE